MDSTTAGKALATIFVHAASAHILRSGVRRGIVLPRIPATGAADAQQHALLAVYLVSSVLNGVYFFPIVYRAFFRSPAEDLPQNGISEAPIACVLPLWAAGKWRRSPCTAVASVPVR